MKAGKYSIKELFNNRFVEQIVIPEIQRDYVWRKKQVEGLLNSIEEDYIAFKIGIENKSQLNIEEEFKIAFEQFYKKQKCSCNIGFIYAYNDPEYDGKYFLIDGQQRLTTIYLLLLVLASEKESFREKFEKFYMVSGLPAIDYKVREASHLFLKEVVDNYRDKGILIEDQPWYYKIYETDKTISSIISNISTIQQFVRDKVLITDDFINYVQEYIEFWYFDTNISEQGEELYIYMNARGEQIQENENLKADLLGKLKVEPCDSYSLLEIKNDWGRKWEEWQQFFWIHKQENTNADKGFNEFIFCVAGLENYLRGKNLIYTKKDFDEDTKGEKNQIAYSDLVDSFDNNGLEKIMRYFDGFIYCFKEENIKQFTKNYKNLTFYKNSTWIDKCLSEVLKIINSQSTNWFADPTDPDRGIEHSRMVFIWSLLLYMSNQDNILERNDEIFRVLRLYYIRFNNFNRSVQNIINEVNNVKLHGPWGAAINDEENQKNNWFTQRINPDDIYKYEEIIWNIEDHPLNSDGREAKAWNCSHIIDFDKFSSLEELSLIMGKFNSLFPVSDEGKICNDHFKKIINILLFYGNFWEDIGSGYQNYYFGNWKKIIRNLNKNNEIQFVFKLFFNDLKIQTLEDLYNEKVLEFEIDKQTISISEQLRWFASQLGEDMWEQGLYIAVNHYNYPDQDEIFRNSKIILNTKGNLRGGYPQILSELISI